MYVNLAEMNNGNIVLRNTVLNAHTNVNYLNIYIMYHVVLVSDNLYTVHDFTSSSVVFCRAVGCGGLVSAYSNK